ncbi:hypothetical protein GLX30_11085 [Streptomyces sp. Tu 2975]|nr:hypothetical protein GLX30_11085 [Streptomyces sp. Tu 2975]
MLRTGAGCCAVALRRKGSRASDHHHAGRHIDGRGGDDTVFGDNRDRSGVSAGAVGGSDRTDAGAGNDTLLGGPGRDLLDGGTGTDDCGGEAGADFETDCEI